MCFFASISSIPNFQFSRQRRTFHYQQDMEEIAHAVTVEALLSVCWSIVRLNGLAGHRERLIWIRNMPEGTYGVWFP